MMEKINLKNYEAYFLDFTEGNLTPAQVAELNQFLYEYPSLKLELDEFEAVVLEEEPIKNSALKESLLREETTGMALADYLMISEVEGTISKEEKAQLAALVKEDAGLIDELSVYHKTKLPVENTILFQKRKAYFKKKEEE